MQIKTIKTTTQEKTDHIANRSQNPEIAAGESVFEISY